jgi:aryl-alcohol dehydrogenase-like predicted oxidoreductase
MPAGARLTNTQRLADLYMTDANWEIVEKLEAFCAARVRTLLDLAFAWLLGNPVVSSVIAGATRPEQLEQNVRAAQWILSAEDRALVDAATAKP